MSQPLPGGVLELVVALLQPFDSILQLFLEILHLVLKCIQTIAADEPDSRLGKRQTDAFVVSEHLAPHGSDVLVGGVLGIEQLLAGGQEVALGPERFGGLVALLLGERLSDAEPGEGNPHRSGILAEPLSGRGGRCAVRHGGSHANLRVGGWIG